MLYSSAGTPSGRGFSVACDLHLTRKSLDIQEESQSWRWHLTHLKCTQRIVQEEVATGMRNFLWLIPTHYGL